MPKSILTPLQRLLSKVKVIPETQCWECQRHRMKGGYATFSIGRKFWLAHRASWMLHNGPIPDEMDVLHKCDNPPCINPDHLFLGDDFINQQDRVAKGRHAGFMGTPRPHVLSDAQIVLLYEEAKAKAAPQKVIAKKYGVSQGLVSLILNQKVLARVTSRAAGT